MSAVANATVAASTVEAVRVDNLHKSFGPLEVIKGVSLTATEGDVIAIIGGSGSGKSTLLRCINFLETPTSGTISICGEPVKMKPDGKGGSMPSDRRQLERIRTSLGMVFQSFNLWQHMTVIQNVVEVPVHVLGQPKDAAYAKAEELLKRVGLWEKRDVYPAFMSGGQQQRAAIARALVQGAKVLLADEPIASLDPAAARRVMESLVGINRNDGITILVSLHQVEYARRFCPRTIAMQAGRVVFDGPSVALTNERLKEIYGSASEELVLPDAADLNGPVAVAA